MKEFEMRWNLSYTKKVFLVLWLRQEVHHLRKQLIVWGASCVEGSLEPEEWWLLKRNDAPCWDDFTEMRLLDELIYWQRPTSWLRWWWSGVGLSDDLVRLVTTEWQQKEMSAFAANKWLLEEMERDSDWIEKMMREGSMRVVGQRLWLSGHAQK